MSQPDLAAELRAYALTYPEEETTVSVFLEFLASPADHYLRQNLAGHLTGSAFVIDEGRSQTLLVHHRKLKLWVQPGGHADGNDNLREVAEKELIEETGITKYVAGGSSPFDFDRHEIPARADVPGHYHYDVRYLFLAERDQKLILSDESTDLRWFSLSAIVNNRLARDGIRTDESVRRMAAKIR